MDGSQFGHIALFMISGNGRKRRKGWSCQITKKVMLQKKKGKCQNYDDGGGRFDDGGVIKDEESMGLPSYKKRQSQNYYNDDEEEEEIMSLCAVRAGNVETKMMVTTLMMIRM